MDNELKVTSGTTATISYENTFADKTKKTVTIGSYRTQDIPDTSTLKNNIADFNEDPDVAQNFSTTFISPSSGAAFTKISGCTITVTQRNVLI